jgi:hypothetical protein
MAKRLYAKDLVMSADQFPQRPAGMRVPGCLCRSHDVQMSSIDLEEIRDIMVRPDAAMWYSIVR